MTLDDDVEDIMKKFRKATRNRKPRKDVSFFVDLIPKQHIGDFSPNTTTS